MNLKFFTKGMMKILYLKPLQLINTYKAYECQLVSDSALQFYQEETILSKRCFL